MKKGVVLSGAFFVLAAAAAFFQCGEAAAQSLTMDMGGSEGSFSGKVLQMVALVTVLSVAPGILVMVTSFTRIVVVLSLLRMALGLQQTPPNSVLISLAMFLTFFIMGPTFETAWREGVSPLVEEQITEEQAIERIVEPFRTFMQANVRQSDLDLFTELSKGTQEAATASPPPAPSYSLSEPEPEREPLRILVPAFMISELWKAFQIGFLLFLPFLVIDMVIASILMSMGMMMLPPVMIALPFKIIFFVLIDGWALISGSLVRSFGGY